MRQQSFKPHLCSRPPTPLSSVCACVSFRLLRGASIWYLNPSLQVAWWMRTLSGDVHGDVEEFVHVQHIWLRLH